MDADIIFHGILWKVARSTKDVAASPNQDGLRSEQEWRRVDTRITEHDKLRCLAGNRTVRGPGSLGQSVVVGWYAWKNEGAKRRERNKRAAGG
jgi:hypothetical protein